MELEELHVLHGHAAPVADPGPVAGEGVGAEVILNIFPKPPVQNTTALARNTCSSPVASS